jgi:excisionase family DNA binding protein
MDRTDPQLVTPREAAKIVGCGRSSIMRALASRSLPATRDNRNVWLIRRDDLDRWSEARTTAGPVPESDTDRSVSEPVTGQGPDLEAAARLAAAEARAETLAAQVVDLRGERDRLLALVERLPELRPAEPAARRGFLSRLFGRNRVRAA